MLINYLDTMARAKKGYARLLEPICKKWDLTRSEMDILLFLLNNPELDRATDIVSRRGIAKSHVSLSVSNLERRGLLVRRFEPSDRRTAHLELTMDGATVAREGKKAQRQFFERIYQGLTEAEFEQWRRITQQVCDNIEHMEEIPDEGR